MLTAQELKFMQKISPFRSQRLFDEFLPMGYEMTTLDTVLIKKEVIELKVILGTLITLYDDFADRPDRFNPHLLQQLYKIPFERVEIHHAFLSEEEKESLSLAKVFFGKLEYGLKKLKNFNLFSSFFYFDLKQFFLANQYSELLTQYNELSNRLENRLYLHHNMGIVMAGMIDLMSLPHFQIQELGRARSLFLLGQRAGRISNVLTTYEREKKEGDITNELLSEQNMKFNLCAPNTKKDNSDDFICLENELENLFQEMEIYKDITSFSMEKYREGIQNLHNLHLNLQGTI